MGVRAIQLRRGSRCRDCRTDLRPGELAYYDEARRLVRCRPCAMGDRPTLPLEVAPTAARARPSDAERARVRALIAEARDALARSRRAG